MDPLHDFDLNLLRTLDALLTERSVTRAAEALGRSQPAVSHALQRLRDALGDPLLVREGRTMVPTPRALAIAPVLKATLGDLTRLLERGTDFDPATAQTTFTLGCPDALGPLLPDILVAMSDAPGVRLELVSSAGALTEVAADLVLEVLPTEAPGIVARRLGAIHQVVAMRAGHPALDRPWTIQEYVSWPHVLVHNGRAAPSVVDEVLAAAGVERTIGLAVPTWLLAPHVVRATNLFLTSAAELLGPVAETMGLVLRDPPLEMPEIPVAAMWPERLAADPAHRWFRDRVAGVARAALNRRA